MRLLAEAVKEAQLSKLDIKYCEEVMSNGMVFKKWTKKEQPDMGMLIKCLKYELNCRPRVRSEIFRRIVELYNRQFTTMNWATASVLMGSQR